MKCGTKTIIVGAVGLVAAIVAFVFGKKAGIKESSLNAMTGLQMTPKRPGR